MNSTVQASITTQLAELALAPTAEAPSGELGYGRDLSCVSDLADDFREIRGDSPAIILEALMRRYQTPRGTLEDDPDYGLDLVARVNAALTPNELRTLQAQCVGEAKKDERIDTLTMELAYNFASKTLSISGTITPRSPRLNPFTYVFSATSAGVVLDAINGRAV